MKRTTHFWISRNDPACDTVAKIFDEWQKVGYDDTGKTIRQVADQMGCDIADLDKYTVTIELKKAKK